MRQNYIKSMLVALLLLCCTVASAHDFEVGGIFYNITDATAKTVKVTYKGDSYSEYNEYSGSVIIPSTVTYNGVTYSVTSIENTAFTYCSGLTSVTIGNSVTSIGYAAFGSCTSLTSVTIGNSVTSIGDNAFQGCNGLTSITIPNSVKSIGYNAFYDCSGLTSITIPNSVTSIGGGAFRGCTGLKTVYNCSSLNIVAGNTGNGYVAYYADKVINAPNGSIEGDFAFAIIDGVNTLVEYIGNGGDVTLPENYNGENYVIGSNIFKDNTTITGITISDGVTSIGDYAFQGCSGLTRIIINRGSIGNYAFDGCTKLASVTIGKGVTSIESTAFYGCTGLKTVYNCSSLNIVAGNTGYGYVAYYADKVINARSIEGDFVFGIKDGVKTLCGYIGNGGDVALPADYNGENYVIGSNAFDGCSGLTSVTIGNGVTSIGNYAFDDCTGLTSVTIGNGVTSIGNYAFDDCTGLASVTIGDGVTSIGSYAFEDCSGLTAVHINDLAAWCRIDFSDDSSNPLSYAHNLYLNGEKVTDLVIPSDITGIKSYTFYNCIGLTSVTIPNSVTSIGNSAFYDCTGLTSVTIPNSVTSIGERTFRGCRNLTSIEIPNSVTSIGDYAFVNCTSLKTVYNYSSLNFLAGSTDNGYVAYYADKVINVDGSSTSIIGDYKFTSYNGVNTLVEYLGDGGDITLPESCNGENYVIDSSVFQDNTTITSVTIPAGVTVIDDNAFDGCTKLASVTIGNGVTSIGYCAFSDCTGLTSITIPNSVTSIGWSAFHDCSGLTSVTIGNSVTSIGGYAFYGCSGLTSITIPNSVTSIGERVFEGCTKLASVTICNSVTSIGDYAFYGCSGLTRIIINSGSIGDYAFYRCSGLTSVIIGSGVTSIGNYAFYDCTGLTSVTIGNSVTSIGSKAFYGCSRLASVTIGNSVTSIGDYAFQGCYNLASIEIPNSVTSIGDYAFQDCTGLARIIINSGSIGESAFYGCTGLTSVTIGNGVTVISDIAFYGCTKLASVTIGEGVRSIGDRAFYGCSGLTSVTIPSSVTSIGFHAFEDCSGLTRIIIKSGSIGDYAFDGCTKLASVTIGEGVTSIESKAFYGCTNLKTVYNCSSLNIVAGNTSNGYVAYYADKVITLIFKVINGVNTLVGYKGDITVLVLPDDYKGKAYAIAADLFKDNTAIISVSIPEGVTAIGDNAFSGCTKLAIVTINSESIGESMFSGCTKLADLTIGNNVASIGDNAFSDCTGLTSVTIPSSVTNVGRSAFSGCTGLTGIEIPNSVTSIGDDVFDGCTGLTSVIIPNSVTSISDAAFRGCTGLTGITIPNSVTSIAGNAFRGCTGLTSITIPNSVTSIGSSAFSGCTGLTAVHINDLVAWCNIDNGGGVLYYAQNLYLNGEEVTDLVIPDGVTNIGNGAFSHYAGLTSVTIPNSVTSIGSSAFVNCTGLTSITIPSSVTSIGSHAFYGCTGLTSVTIPNSVTSISDATFSSCYGLTSVTIPNSVTSIGSNAFWYCSGLTSIVIPNSVTSIDGIAFDGCTNLKTVYNCSSLNIVAGSTDNGYVAYYADEVINIPNGSIEGDFVFGIIDGVKTLCGYIGNGGDVTLPADYNGENYVIGDSVFQDNTTITSVTIPAGVTAIGDNAFYGCTNLKTVTNKSSLNIVKSSTDNGYLAYYADEVINADGSSTSIIGDYKFTSANGVNTLVEYLGDGGDITLPESYNGENYVIGSSVFQDNTTITGVTIPAGVTAIGDNAFFGCDGLKTVTNNSSLNIVAGSTDNGYVAYYADKVINTDGSSTSIIGDYKFTSYNGVNTLVEYLGDGGDITLPENYNGENYVIGADVFKDNTAITSVTIPAGVTAIGDNAFYGCENLKTVTNNSSLNIVLGITDNGYVAYYADKVINADGSSNGVIGDYKFTSANGVNTLVGYTGNATELTLPTDYNGENYVIGSSVFYNNTAITGVTIPAGVTAIGDNVFYGCENLKTVTNNSSLNIVLGSTDNGYAAYYADKVINADGSSNGVIGDYKFTSANGVNTLVEYLGNSKEITLDSWTSTNAGVDSSISENTWTINAQAGDILTFDWRVSSESGWDKLIVTIDGSEILNESGEGSGNYNHTFENAGTYTLVAQYTKDGSAHAGDDCASISNMKIASNGNASIALVLPENYNGENYVIGGMVFQDNTTITSVTIPAGVTAIGDNAFYGCENLKTVTNNSSLNIVLGSTDNGYVAYYADNVITINADGSSTSIIGDYKFTSANGVNTLVEYLGDGGNITLPENYNGENYVIGGMVFYDNTSLISVTIPNSVTSIGNYAFCGCSGLTSVTIGSGVTIIDEGAFLNCSGLASVTIPNSVTSIGSSAFHSCYNLASIEIPNSVTNIGEWAFYFCHNLASIEIPNSVTSIGDYAFYVCSGLTDIVIPNSVTSIGEGTFCACRGLTSVVIPNSVTSIGGYAFEDCTGLTSIEIPNSVTSIGDNAFYGCENLKTVTNNSSLNIVLGSTDNGYVAYYADKVINADGSSTSIIGDYKFTSYNGVKTLVEYLGNGGDITLPENYNGENYVIGSSVFFYNTTITSVTIPAGVTAIGDNAFPGCTGLTGVTIGDGVTAIGDNAFEGCSGLTSIEIPNSVTSIGSQAFYGCSGLTAVHINDLAAWCRIDFSSSSSNPLHLCKNLYLNGELVTDLVIPSDITEIKQYAFFGCSGLTSVTIGNSVTSIGDYAFQGCSGLASVTIGDGVTSIGIYAFYDCTGLTSVTIGNGVTSIGSCAFYNCSGLTSITIPNSVTSIGDYAFENCWQLKTVYNNSSLNIVAGSTDNGYVAYYADEVITPPSISYTSLPAYFNTDNGLPGTIEGNNHIWESETMYFETPKSGIRITVFDINEGEYYNNVPMVALGELEFYDADGNKINYTASDVTTNSLEESEGSLAALCDGDYSTYYHSTWRSGTTPTDFVYLDVKFPQAVDAVSIKIVGRDKKRIVPTSIGITENGEYCEISAPTNGTCGESTTWSYNDGVLTISGSGAVTDKGWNKYINKIIGVVIEEGITSIMNNAFLRYSNLTSATLPGTLTVLPQGVFSRTGLTGIEIPEGVTTLGMWAFDNCPALATVTLPTTLTSISDYAFENCTALASVTSNAVIAPTLGANVFGGIAEGATLTYPQGSDYSSWSDYFTISLFTPGDINGDSEVNVGDFASLVNLIFNSDNIDAATMAVADINGDGEVNVGDFAGLVNLIFNSGSQAAPKRAAALAATVEPSLYIEPFSIAPGEQKQIAVLLDNPGEKFSQLQFNLALPEGIEIVFDEDNFCDMIDCGSRLSSKVYSIETNHKDGYVQILGITTNKNAYIKGESGDVALITVQAADDIADGVYNLSINNVVLSHQDGSTVKAASTTAAITVSSTTGITNVEAAEGSDVYYDLQGRAVKEPSNGFYIVNGKKVFIK